MLPVCLSVLEVISVVEGLLFWLYSLLCPLRKVSCTHGLKHSHPDTKVDEAAENEFDILFSLHIYYNFRVNGLRSHLSLQRLNYRQNGVPQNHR